MGKININETYEIYQIITDFGNPLEIFREAFQNAVDENATKVYCQIYENQKISGSELIIDIWNNGNGLKKEDVNKFFDLANSTKIDQNGIPVTGKLGYKGHGSKIFFNSKEVIITSKLKNDYWSVTLDSPLTQIEEKNQIEYSIFKKPQDTKVELPDNWENGFFVRIKSHLHFQTEHTKFMLNHKSLRDYSKWYTVFGSIKPFFDEKLKNLNIKLHMKGLDFETFKQTDSRNLVPRPVFSDDDTFEILELGHYFPPERYTERKMKKYVKEIKSSKQYWDYYSRIGYKGQVSCENNVNFNLIISVEGYETKREYDLLLSRRGKPANSLTHNDSQRYGIWACKGGIPVEKIDNWIEGGKGQYTYLKAFVDCDDFKLTANRGSIHNTEIEKLDIIKKKLNELFSQKKLKDILNERTEIEKFEYLLSSIEEDGKNLKKRFDKSQKCKKIILPNSIELKEPNKLSSGYSESETLVLLIQLITVYPKLFTFNLCDYDTTRGIDFIVKDGEHPKYVELKGTLGKKMNHPFRYIYKFICYDISPTAGEIIEDSEFKTKLVINNSDSFQSFDDNFKDKKYTSYKLDPSSAAIPSMEIISLKSILEEVIHAKIQ